MYLYVIAPILKLIVYIDIEYIENASQTARQRQFPCGRARG